MQEATEQWSSALASVMLLKSPGRNCPTIVFTNKYYYSSLESDCAKAAPRPCLH